MKIRKSLHLAWNMLTHSKVRSWLTIIGIIIGIGAVVAIVSVSQGAQKSMEEQMSGLGADIVTITPGGGRAQGMMGGGGPGGMFSSSDDDEQENLTKKDVLVLKAISNVKVVMGTVSATGDLIYKGDTISQSVTGVDTEVWEDITLEEIEEGRALTQTDIYAIVIGDQIAEDTFDEEISINQKISIEGKSFKVVGIVSNSRSIYMPIKQARVLFDDIGDKEFDSISVKLENAEDGDLFDATIDEIEEKLMLARGILKEEEKDFRISSNKEMQESMSEMLSTLSLFLGSIAAISLLVGAVGISNTMFTSVLEKTREIGIMKAIGAKNRDILSIFLLNAGMIGLVGGIGGVLAGGIAASFISSLTGTTTTTGGGPGRGLTGMFSSSYLSWELVVGALFFAVVIGMIAGAIPAWNASRLKPVDALRYE